MADTVSYQLTTHNNNSPGWIDYTIAIVFELAALALPSGEITHVRVTLQNPTTEGVDILKLYVGHGAAAGDVYDFATAPAQVLFGGSGSKYVGTSTPEPSDWKSFVYNKTSRLVLAWYMNTNNDTVIYRDGQANLSSYYAPGDSAATVDKSGFTQLAGDNYMIRMIEFRTVDAPSGLAAYY